MRSASDGAGNQGVRPLARRVTTGRSGLKRYDSARHTSASRLSHHRPCQSCRSPAPRRPESGRETGYDRSKRRFVESRRAAQAPRWLEAQPPRGKAHRAGDSEKKRTRSAIELALSASCVTSARRGAANSLTGLGLPGAVRAVLVPSPDVETQDHRGPGQCRETPVLIVAARCSGRDLIRARTSSSNPRDSNVPSRRLV